MSSESSDIDISMNQLSEHVAKKHPYPSNDSDDDVNIIENAAPATADTIIILSSDDEMDYQPLIKKGYFDDDNDDGIATTSALNDPVQNVRSTAHSSVHQQQLNDGGEMDEQNCQQKVQAARKLDDSIRSQAEFRILNVSGGDGNDGRSFVNGYDNGNPKHDRKPRRDCKPRYVGKLKRDAKSSPPQKRRAQKIPENFVACQFCSNVMHQDYVRAHIERKHRQSLPVANGSLTGANINGINSIPKASDNVDDTGNGNGVADGGGINGAIVVKMEKSEEPLFTRCKWCSSYMNINFMPTHLVRKHRLEYVDSIGLIWTQCTDTEANQLLKSGRVYVKDGAFYVGELE